MQLNATALAATFAGVAALAASTQAYVSWSSRNHIFKATVATAASANCSEASSGLRRLLIHIKGEPFPSDPVSGLEWVRTTRDTISLVMDKAVEVADFSSTLKSSDPKLIVELLKVFDSASERIREKTELGKAQADDLRMMGEELIKVRPLLRDLCGKIRSSIIGD